MDDFPRGKDGFSTSMLLYPRVMVYHGPHWGEILVISSNQGTVRYSMVWYFTRLPAVHKTEVFGCAENVPFPPQTWLIISSGRYFPRGWKPPIILLDSMMCGNWSISIGLSGFVARWGIPKLSGLKGHCLFTRTPSNRNRLPIFYIFRDSLKFILNRSKL